MIFHSRVTIIFLSVVLLANAGAIDQCRDKRTGASRTENTNTTKPVANNSGPQNMNSEKRNEGHKVEETVWGGQHVRLVIGETRSEIEFDCAHGAIKGRFSTDADGQFDLPGTFAREGGPVREDESDSGKPVRYKGKITGDTMTLTIIMSESNQRLDDFTLTRGNQGQLRKCK